MDVTIKLVTRGSKANEKLVSTHPCIIRILNEHNHSFNDAINLGSLKFSEKTKEKFFSYFDKGMSASQATRFHETQTLHRDGLIGFANTAINPKHRSICYLHNRWRHYNFGTYGGEDMIAAVNRYRAACDPDIQWRTLDKDVFVFGIITPFMKRVHIHLKQSSEIVFVDTTSQLDSTNAAVTVLMCHSTFGALPLGVIVAPSQDHICYEQGKIIALIVFCLQYFTSRIFKKYCY